MEHTMQFALVGRFADGSETKHDAIHELFNEHLMQRTARARFGGPLYDQVGRRVGILMIIETADFAAAEAFLRASPYQQAGLYDQVEIHEIRPEVGGLE
jgi:uncharacterized protein YciI